MLGEDRGLDHVPSHGRTRRGWRRAWPGPRRARYRLRWPRPPVVAIEDREEREERRGPLWIEAVLVNRVVRPASGELLLPETNSTISITRSRSITSRPVTCWNRRASSPRPCIAYIGARLWSLRTCFGERPPDAATPLWPPSPGAGARAARLDHRSASTIETVGRGPGGGAAGRPRARTPAAATAPRWPPSICPWPGRPSPRASCAPASSRKPPPGACNRRPSRRHHIRHVRGRFKRAPARSIRRAARLAYGGITGAGRPPMIAIAWLSRTNPAPATLRRPGGRRAPTAPTRPTASSSWRN